MPSILSKYANLLINYCTSIKEGERVLIQSTTLAEPLVREVYREALRAGGLPHVSMDFRDQRNIRLNESNESQLNYVDPMYALAMQEFDAYIFIRAPFYSRGTQKVNSENTKIDTAAKKPYGTRY